jgi:Mn2+/Fe2+ NRAMP family transporter
MSTRAETERRARRSGEGRFAREDGPGGRGLIPAPPTGWGRFVWLGPGLIWMLSAAASGELLFTPRVAALYGYALLWMLVIALALKLLINREIGRYTVCTGRGLLDGFNDLPGPRGWAVWLILLPQVIVAVASIAGLAGGAASAATLELPGSIELWMVITTVTAVSLVLWGRYTGVERVATFVALAIGIGGVAAAASTGPDVAEVASGLEPGVPDDFEVAEILPWLGFASAGAAGLVWYSYWIRAKGFGAASPSLRDEGAGEGIDPADLDGEDRGRLRGWLRQMTLDTCVAIGGTFVVMISFMILGAELLRPEGIIPDEADVAGDLTNLFEGVWGNFGFWFLLVGIYVGFWDTVLTDQDGWGRMFANGTRSLAARAGRAGRWVDEAFLGRVYLVVLLAVIPIIVFLIWGEPVDILKLAGTIEAIHIPIVAMLTLYVNRRLPRDLRASGVLTAVVALASLAFAVFAGYYITVEW